MNSATRPLEQRPVGSKWWTLTAVSIGVFMLMLDISVVNVALPDIRRALNASFTDLQWVVDAYALALAASLLAFGSVADLVGRRRIFALGLAVFIVSSLACGLARHADVLNISRAVQGLGGAMMFATSLALIADAFRGKDRGTAFGVFGAVTGGGIAIGPLIGGVIAEWAGWEWIFFINVPVGIFAILLTLQKVAPSKDPRGHRIDWLGVVTFSASLFLLVLSLIKGNDLGWTTTRMLAQLGGAFALLVVFVIIELHREHPLFELALFRKPAFLGASIAGFAISASMFSLSLYLTLYLQNYLGYSPLDAGVRFLPNSLLSFAVAPLAGWLTVRMAPRWFLGGGLLLIAIGIWMMADVKLDSPWTFLLPGFIVSGVGIGLCNPPLASTAVGVVPVSRSGMGSGINATFRQIGIATGIAGLGALFQSSVHSKLIETLAGTPAAEHSQELSRAVTSGAISDVVQSMPEGAQQVVAAAGRQAFISGYHTIFYVSAGVALVGAVLSTLLVRPRDFVSPDAPETDPAVPEQG